MKHLFLILLVFVLSNSFAQNNITFYRFSQAHIQKFFDAVVLNNGEKYKFIGVENVGMSISYYSFVLTEYDSLGILQNKYDLSYIYNHGYSFHDGYGYAEFLDNGNLFMNFLVKLPPPNSYHSCLLDSSKNVVWRDSLIYEVKPLGSDYVGIVCNEKECLLKKVDLHGRKIWEIPSSVLYPSEAFHMRVYLIDSLVSVIAYNRIDSTVIYYEAFVTNDGKLLRNDSFVFVSKMGYTWPDIYRFPQGYVFTDSYREYYLFILDNNKNKIWENFFLPQNYYTSVNIDKYGNYHLLLKRNDLKNDTSAVFEYFKINSKGKLLTNKMFQLKYPNIAITRILPLEDNQFLLFGIYILNDILSAGMFIKTDSNFNVNEINSIKQPNWKSGNISISPNPLTTTTTFTLPTSPGQKAELRLYNITGKLVKQEAFTGNSFQLERGNLPTGMYLYHILAGDKVFTGKVLVE